MVTIKDNKVNSSKKIESRPLVEYVYVPLEDANGKYKVLKKENDYVYKNEIIGILENDFPIHSPVSGYVKGLEKKIDCQGKQIDTLKIKSDLKEKIKVEKHKQRDISLMKKKELIKLLCQKGIVGLSGNGFPTFIKYNHNYDYLIVNGMECEPYISCDNAVMYQYAEEILTCLDYLSEIMKLKKIYLAINIMNKKIINNFLKYISSYPHIRIYPINNYYPNGWEKNLVREIIKKDYKQYPYEVGTLVSNVSTIYAIYEMLVYDKPLTSRVITICGDGIKNGVNVRVKIGDILSDVINNHGKYKKNIKDCLFITKGPMNGISHNSDDIVVTKDLTGVVVLKNVDEEVNPCIRCGKCIKVCPAKLEPVTIMNKISNLDKIKKMPVNRCIGCGLCSYICPAHIEVREFVQKAKGRLL